MKVRVLGCSGGINRNVATTSFLVDDDILIDAGTGVVSISSPISNATGKARRRRKL